jgi:hypothetical protein
LALHCFAAEMSIAAAALMDPSPAQEAFIMAKKFMGLLVGMAVVGGAASDLKHSTFIPKTHAAEPPPLIAADNRT